MPKEIVTISVRCRMDPANVSQVTNDLQEIIRNLDAEEISLLRKAVNNPLIKSAALSELRKRLF